jgi:hypothetical protein
MAQGVSKRDKDHEYGLKYAVRVAGGVVRTAKWFATSTERAAAITEIKTRTSKNLISIRRMGK